MTNEMETRVRAQLRLAFNETAADELIALARAKGGEMTEGTRQCLRSKLLGQAEPLIDSFQSGSPIPTRQSQTLARVACAYWVPAELNALLS